LLTLRVVVALEAGQIMASEDDIHLVEIEDLVIHKAIVFYDEKTGVETITTLSNITTHNNSSDAKLSITADFTISAHLSRDQMVLTKAASGKIRVIVGESSCVPALPSRGPTPPHLLDIDIDRFYSSLANIGYGYTDRFQAFSEMKRRLNYATGIIEQPAAKTQEKQLLVHPGLLDHAFQALFGAFSWPGDGRFWSLFLPTSVKKVTIDTSLYRELKRKGLSIEKLAFDAWLVDSPAREMRGDVVFSTPDEAESSAVIQVEGASMISFFESPARDDRAMFFETEWGLSVPDGKLVVGRERATNEELELAEACERIAYYYWRRLEDTLTSSDRENCSDHHKHLLSAITHLLGQEMDGKKSFLKKEWYNDSEEIISALIEK
jgi:hybrid polyketide synthase/nonribosomal peptide synthetase ACE1